MKTFLVALQVLSQAASPTPTTPEAASPEPSAAPQAEPSNASPLNAEPQTQTQTQIGGESETATTTEQAAVQAPTTDSQPAPAASPDMPINAHWGRRTPTKRRSTTQVQLDLFDFFSPGYGFWVNHVRHRRNGRPSWQIALAGGSFFHYTRGELRDVGWGRAADQRFYGRLAASAFLWRGLFLGGQMEVMVRRVRQPTTNERLTTVFPTLQPAIGYHAQPWGWHSGHVGFMLWVAPRFFLLRKELVFSDGESAHGLGVVEFASGLNLAVNF